MEKTIITELVNFKVLETLSNEEVIERANAFNEFQSKQDGFIDAELIKNVADNSWCFVYHYENMEKMKAIGEKLRSCGVFDEFSKIIEPETLRLNFHQQIKKW